MKTTEGGGANNQDAPPCAAGRILAPFLHLLVTDKGSVQLVAERDPAGPRVVVPSEELKKVGVRLRANS